MLAHIQAVPRLAYGRENNFNWKSFCALKAMVEAVSTVRLRRLK
jgi:hypothetical protein